MKVCIVCVVFKDTANGITVEKTKNEVAKADSPAIAVEKVKALYLTKGIVPREVRSYVPQEIIE
jgi:hypothetical protein